MAKIRRIVSRKGTVSFQLDLGFVNGVRVRKSYPSRQVAERFKASALAARKQTGELGVAAMSSNEVIDFMAARKKLDSAGVDVNEAVEFFLKHSKKVKERVLLRKLIERYTAEKKRLKRSARTLETLNSTLPMLARSLPLHHADDVTREEIKTWLRSHGWAARTHNNRLGEIRTFFRWAVEYRFCAQNPCDGIEEETEVPEEIGTLTLEECERLLERSRGTMLAAYVAIGLFCGLRRAEIERLSWPFVNLVECHLTVVGKSAKTRARRVIDIPKVAIPWLQEAYERDPRSARGPSRKVTPANLKDDWPAFREEIGLKHWPHNAMRHTFASYHYAMFQNENELQALLGQDSPDVLHDNYRALKTKLEAQRFWSLAPKGSALPAAGRAHASADSGLQVGAASGAES